MLLLTSFQPCSIPFIPICPTKHASYDMQLTLPTGFIPFPCLSGATNKTCRCRSILVPPISCVPILLFSLSLFLILALHSLILENEIQWLASTSCSTSSCGQAKPALYDSSNSKPTGRDFEITYVEGKVNGPIVWDTVRIGDYEIDNQALGSSLS